MASFLDKVNELKLSRRNFIKASAGAAASLSLAGCGNTLTQATADNLTNSQGEWITGACWHLCGGRCLNKALVVDGVVVRQKTDDTHEDSPEYPQQRGCARGRSQRQQVFGVDRLKYPMKRKSWSPGNGGNKELRGKDEWERISWEEALDYIAAEIKRVKEDYGNESILCNYPYGAINAYGGCTAYYGTVSNGAWIAPLKHMTGTMARAQNDRFDLKKAKLIVLWGANPVWSSSGTPTYNFRQAKEAGAKFIVVDPYFNDTAAVLADEWIPVRPGTDTALLLGIAHYMITNNLQDQAFLDKYCVGFDADHMPEGADPKENFKDYVLGTYDGVPKTPEWASEHCGTDPDLIRSFAHEIAVTKPMTMTSSSAAARNFLGEQFAQAFMTVGWMTGNVGKPGAAICYNNRLTTQSYGGPNLVQPGMTKETNYPTNPLFPYGGYFPVPEAEKTNWSAITFDEVWDAVLDGEYTAGVRGKIPIDIRLILSMGEMHNNVLNQNPNLMKGIEAFRKVDFACYVGHFLNTTAAYSDIVLPATTYWERVGGVLQGNPEIVIHYSKVTEPLYEAKDDLWIVQEIGKRLGFDPKDLVPKTPEQRYYDIVAGATVIKEDGKGYEPLVTITAEDIKELDVEGVPQQGRIGYKEFKERGIYQVKRYEGDPYGFISYKQFIADPENNPVPTKSGKFQIHSQSLVDYVQGYGYSTLAPIAKWEYSQEGFDNYMAFTKENSEYPLSLWTTHYARRAHSTLDNIPWLKEAFRNNLYMNPADAAARGINRGDVAKISSKCGTTLRHVYLTERIMPGTVMIAQGTWAEIDEETGIDKAGSTNVLQGGPPVGQGVQPWNSSSVQIEKYEGPIKLDPDYKWPLRVVNV